MATYLYRAVDKEGKEVRGEMNAADSNEVLANLRQLGYFPTQIAAKTSGPQLSRVISMKTLAEQMTFSSFGYQQAVSQKDITMFIRQLATLISAGFPLVRALHILANQMRRGLLQDILRDVSSMVESGSSFSQALEKYPKNFSRLFINSVKAGEVGGVLEVILERLADYFEKNERIRAKIRAALVYPIVVVTIAVIVLTILMVVVVPKFMDLFHDLGTDLPFLTKMLVFTSTFLATKWYLIILGVILLIAGYRLAVRTVAVRRFVDGAKLHGPIVGPLITKLIVAGFSRTLGTLLPSGVPILQALAVTRDTCGNVVVAEAIDVVYGQVREGESIAKPLSKTRIFPSMVVNMIEIGEETGALDRMLLKIADIYENEVDVAVETLMSLLEPMLIVMMGLMVGLIVISMFLPLIQLLTAIS